IAEGKATRYGDVRPLVEDADDLLAVLAPGDALWLDFDGGSEIAPGKTVTYFLKLTGWAKESGFYNATGRAIEPLPFRAMTSYPYGDAEAPSSPEYREYLETWQTRWVTNTAGAPRR